MTLILDLTDEQESRLKGKAERLGLGVEDFVRQVLDREAPADPKPRAGAEFVDYLEREGVLGIWADRTDVPDSPEYARQLRRKAETRS